MARINRSGVIQKAVSDLGLSISTDKIPTETLDKVQLTYDLRKQYSEFIAAASIITTGTTTLTMPSVDARGEIYVTSITGGFAKDATCDIGTGNISITCTPDKSGISQTILIFPVITLTAQDQILSLSFPYPLKLKPNTNMSMTGAFTVGVLSRSWSCQGFTISSN